MTKNLSWNMNCPRLVRVSFTYILTLNLRVDSGQSLLNESVFYRLESVRKFRWWRDSGFFITIRIKTCISDKFQVCAFSFCKLIRANLSNGSDALGKLPLCDILSANLLDSSIETINISFYSKLRNRLIVVFIQIYASFLDRQIPAFS